MSRLLETVERYFQAIRNLDREGFLGCFADQTEHHDPVGAPVRTTPEQVGEFWDQITGLFQRVSLTPDNTYPGGADQVAVKWTGRGTGKNGREVVFEGIDLFEGAEDGRIRRLLAFWDPGPTLAALTS